MGDSIANDYDPGYPGNCKESTEALLYLVRNFQA